MKQELTRLKSIITLVIIFGFISQSQ